MLVQSLKPEVNATQLLTQAGIIPTPPPTGDVQSSVICSEGTKTAEDSKKAERTRMGAAVEQREGVEHQLLDTGKHTEEPTIQQDEVLQIVRQINTEVEPNSTAEVPKEVQGESISMEAEKANAAKQPLLTPEEVAANLATGNLETTEMDMGADGDSGLNSTERVEGTTDENTKKERSGRRLLEMRLQEWKLLPSVRTSEITLIWIRLGWNGLPCCSFFRFRLRVGDACWVGFGDFGVRSC